MDGFAEELARFRSPITTLFMEMDPSLELLGSFPGLSAAMVENPSLGAALFLSDDCPPPEHPFADLAASGVGGFSPVPLITVKSRTPPPETRSPVSCVLTEGGGRCESNRTPLVRLDTAAVIASAPPSEGQGATAAAKVKKKKSGSCRGQEGLSAKEKLLEVVHVRAKRGQATDRHSLAERVRREKINEKMKCLQDLVPGCCKAMGMAVMLDEIIKYVKSLQNQVEFLSMKLSAASAIYDFNLDQLEDPAPPPLLVPAHLLPKVGDGDDAQEADTLMKRRYEGCATFHPILPY